MKIEALLLSFIMCGLGTALAFVYLNPWGLVIDSLGFMMFLYGMFSKEEDEDWKYEARESRKKRIAQEKYICRYCAYFGKPGCKRNEQFINSKPCEDYMLSPWE